MPMSGNKKSGHRLHNHDIKSMCEQRANKTHISYGYVQNIAATEKQLTPAPLQCGPSYLPCSITATVKSQTATMPQPPFSPGVTHATFDSSRETRLGSKATVLCLQMKFNVTQQQDSLPRQKRNSGVLLINDRATGASMYTKKWQCLKGD